MISKDTKQSLITEHGESPQDTGKPIYLRVGR